jgi:hypothetical protein
VRSLTKGLGLILLAVSCVLAVAAGPALAGSVPGDSYRGVYISEYTILSNSKVEMVVANGADIGRDTVDWTLELRKNGKTVGSAKIQNEIDAHTSQVVTIKNWDGKHFDRVALRTGGDRVSKKTRVESEVPNGMDWKQSTRVLRSLNGNSWGWTVKKTGGAKHNDDRKKPRHR